MRRAALFLFLAGCSSVKPAWSIVQTSDETKRSLADGEVIGGEGKYKSHAWLGIPFAAPPVGPLRWRAPKAAERWTTPLSATRFKSACVQPATVFVTNEEADGDVLGTEDCLYLNVWAPKFEPAKVPQGEARLPVMVWIHGGANSLGSAAAYDLGHLATAQKVIGVSVQYRLGPLGWFKNAALKEGEGDAVEDSGNYGTLDLIRALEWVRDNAAAFGGDPGNVTIFGESAGGQNVYSLLLSARAKGLFHRAIAQSPVLAKGTMAIAENYTDDAKAPGHRNSTNEVVARMLIAEGAADRAAAKKKAEDLGPAKIAAWLRAKSGAEIVRAYLKGNADASLRMLDMPLVFPDGTVEPAEPWAVAFGKPGWNQVPVLTGSNHDEAKLFLFLDPKYTWKLFGKLPRIRDEARYESTSQTMSRLWKAKAVDDVAEAMIASGAPAVYAYRFDWNQLPTKLGTNLSKILGAAHGMEIQFAHGHFEGQLATFLGEEGRVEREALSAAMMQHWGDFARNGKPGEQWLPYDPAPGAAKFLVLDAAPAGIRMDTSVERSAQIVADLLADNRIPALKDKCDGLHRMEKVGFVDLAQIPKDCPPKTE